MLRQRADGAEPLVMKEIRHALVVCGYRRWLDRKWRLGSGAMEGQQANQQRRTNE